jgi:hypothetical protein
MEARKVIEVQAENYIEEQILLEAFPEAVWFTGVGNTRFYLDEYMEEEVNEKIREMKGEQE